MADTTARLLGVLSLLQSRPRWSGPQLADRFGVTVRTIRRDVDRLRNLGYPIETTSGAAGGYRLGAGGSAMPPLMLDRDEAVAVAVCLRSVAAESIAGGGDSAVRALGKLERLLPPALARQVGAIGTVTSRLAGASAPVATEVLLTVTRACRDGERLGVRYRDHADRQSERTLDPHRVVSTARRWYLVARDRDHGEWRTFRIDRMMDVEPTGHRVHLDDPPEAVGFVHRAITTSPYVHQVRIELFAPIAEVRHAVPATTGILEGTADDTTVLTTGADHLDHLISHVMMLDVDFRVLDGTALQRRLGQLAARLAAAAGR